MTRALRASLPRLLSLLALSLASAPARAQDPGPSPTEDLGPQGPTAPPPSPAPPEPDDRLQVDTNEPPLPLPEPPPVDEQAPLEPLPSEAPQLEEAPAVEAPPTPPQSSIEPIPRPLPPVDTAPPAEDAPTPAAPPSPSPPPFIPLPPAPKPSLLQALLWLLAANLSIMMAGRAQRWLTGLPAQGLLPTLGRGVVFAGRLCGPLFGLLGVMYLLPAEWAVAAPYVLVGAALALGWTARDLLRDVLGGVLLSLEGRVQPQTRVRFRGLSGVVESLDLRALILLDDEGQHITIPNRLLIEDVLAVDPDPYAPVEVTVHVPSGAGAQHVHQVLEEIALLSPYLAPSRPPHVYRDPDHKDIWIISARLVHPRYAKEFRGALVELADEAFGVGGPKPPPGQP